MATEEPALIEDIHASPRDDIPRLIYADWLDDNGEPEYAELIRDQCTQPCFSLAFGYRLPEPRIALGYEWAEFDNRARIERASNLLRNLSRSERLSHWFFRASPNRMYRGLPVSQEYLSDLQGGEYALDPRSPDCPLLRFDFHIQTDYLQDWLDDPLLHYAESLLFFPDVHEDRQFSPDDIWALADSTLPDRVSELTIGGDPSPEVLELIAELLLPRLPLTGMDRPPPPSRPNR